MLCITETHLNYDKFNLRNENNKIEKFRSTDDVRGGGLMLIYKDKDYIEIKALEVNSPDILHAKASIYGYKFSLILVYMSVNNIDRNVNIRNQLRNILQSNSEPCIVLGDMNAHVGFLGNQKLNRNGQILLNLMEEFNLIMLNDVQERSGTYTWSDRGMKSVIDYVLLNKEMYEIFTEIEIDENKLKYDLSDHNLIITEFSLKINGGSQYSKSHWINTKYLKFSDANVKKYTEELEGELNDTEMNFNISTIDKKIKTLAIKNMEQRRKIKSNLKKENAQSEQVWINNDIREAIKVRKTYNRMKRNEQDEEEKANLNNKYLEQKYKVQDMIRVAKREHELKIVNEIKRDQGNKKMWKHINKLRGNGSKSKKETHIYNEQEQKLEQHEAEQELNNFWTQIYRRHDNKIDDIWNPITKTVYKYYHEHEARIGIITDRDEYYQAPAHFEEHLDMAFIPKYIITPMSLPEITNKDVNDYLKKLKPNKAAGPDGIRPELYKFLTNNDTCLNAIKISLNKIIQGEEEVPPNWKKTNTKLIPKCSKPLAKDLRPIALSNISYKLFMAIVKNKIECHLEANRAMMDRQAGFTKGSRIEDNLFLLKYCVMSSFKNKNSLIVTAIDFSKAFDSIKRDKLIKAMINFRVHPRLIDIIANLYDGDKTLLQLNNEVSKEIEITSGIKQGCTGSTSLFKLVTYMILIHLEDTGIGFKDLAFYFNTIFFADDGLNLTKSIEETKLSIQTINRVVTEYGLEINTTKSHILIYNKKETPNEIEGIEVTNSIVYLGVTITNKKKLFKQHKDNMILKAHRLANQVPSIIARSCNKIIIGKAFWKSVALPAVLYGNQVIHYNEKEIQQLQVIENRVYRYILGAPIHTPTCTLRGEIGASEMRSRLIKNKINFVKYMKHKEGSVVKAAYEEMRRTHKKDDWIKGINEAFEKTNIRETEVANMSELKIKKAVNELDTRRWKQELEEKRSVKLYKENKPEIKEEHFYDNTPSSITLFRCRTNTLQLNDRKRFSGEDTKCIACEEENENLEHFILYCERYQCVRNKSNLFNRPYQENKLSDLLFEKEGDIKVVKRLVHSMWSIREKLLQPNN